MNQAQVINKTKDFVEAAFKNEETGHDWWHMYRVWKLSKYIAAHEKDVDPYIVELGALLHDIADWKFHDGDLEAGPKAARKWLESVGVNNETILAIEDIIRNVSYKGSGVKQNMKSKEGQIVSDADKLDALGAIGIARAFVYGGSMSRPLYDPDVKPVDHQTFEAYKNGKSHTINHFYEKLLLLKDKMYTKTAKDIAEQRHDYLEQFLEEFYKEWDVKL
jgi:uncharacterized protein